MTKAIVYTVSSCSACSKLREDWTKEGKDFEERQVNKSQRWLDEALKYGDMVPIVVYENGRVEIGYENMTG